MDLVACVKSRWGLFVSVVLAALCYIPSIISYYFEDDWCHIAFVSNPHNNIWGFHTWFYRPLFLLSFRAFYHLFGFHSALWHVVVTGFHLVNIALVYWLIKRLRFSETAAAVGTVFYVLCPLHAGAVNWLSDFSGIMAGFCGLVCAHIAFGKKIPAIARGILCSVVFTIGLFFKEEIACLLFVLPFLPMFTDRKISKSEFVKWVAGCLLMLAGLLVFIHCERQCNLDLGNRNVEINPSMMRSAVRFIMWPFTESIWGAGLAYTSLSAALVVLPIIVLWKRYSALRPGLFWYMAASVTMGIALGTIPRCDRYFYIPSIGIAICFAALADYAVHKTKPLGFNLWIVLGAMTLSLASISIHISTWPLAVLLACLYAADAGSLPRKQGACLGVVVLAVTRAFVFWLFPAFQMVIDQPWLLVTLPFMVFAAIVLIRTLRKAEICWAEVLLCCCAALWVQSTAFIAFMAVIGAIEYIRANLETKVKEPAFSINIRNRVQKYGLAVLIGAVALYWSVNLMSENIAWYNNGLSTKDKAHSITRQMKHLPKSANVLVGGKYVSISERWMFNLCAGELAHRPDLRMCSCRLPLPEHPNYWIEFKNGKPLLMRPPSRAWEQKRMKSRFSKVQKSESSVY